MKALTFTGIKSISYESVPDPEIVGGDDVIVKMKRCAICGSDLHVYFGREQGIDQHTCMGHEFAGEIVDVGRDVKALSVGDIVLSPFTTSCGECYYCRMGLTSRCIHNQLFGWMQSGNGLQGGQAEYVRVPLADSTLVKLPDGVSLDEGVLAGDIISTGFYSAKNAAIQPEGVYVVIGCGPVGLMAILGAREYGAQKIFAVDKEPERLKLATEFGTTPINAASENVSEIVYEATQGRGADAVMEAIGNDFGLQLSYSLVRAGGIISSVGVNTSTNLPITPTQLYDKNLTLISGRCPARAMIPTIIPLIQVRKYPFTRIITHQMSLADGANAYEIFANKKDGCIKIMLEP